MDLATLTAALAPLAFIIYWLTDTLKDVTNKNVNGILTRGSAFLGAFVIVVLYAHSSLDLGGTHALMAQLGWADEILLGLAIAAGGGTLADGFRTFNRSDPTVKPTLVPAASPVVLAPPVEAVVLDPPVA